MKRVAAYYRRSKAEAGESESASIGLQRQAVAKLAKHEGWTVDAEFIDDGFSGGSTDRPEFQRLLGEIKRGKYRAVLCYRLDRWSRSVLDFHATWQVLQDNGCDFISVQDRFDTSSETGRLMMGILATFSQFERETISRRIQDGKNEARRKGKYVAKPPAGYTIGEDGKLRPNADAKAIKWLYRECLKSGHSTYVLSERMRRRFGKRQDGGQWSSDVVRWILKNPRYLGHVISNDKIVERDAFQPLVDQETFDAVQKQLATNKATKRRDGGYLFSGKVICGLCGAPMRGSGASKSKARLYRCRKDKGCGRTTAQEQDILDQVVDTLRASLTFVDALVEGRLSGDPEHIRELAEPIAGIFAKFIPDATESTERRSVKDIERDIQTTRRRLDRAVAKSLEDDEIGRAFDRQVEKLKRQIDDLKAELFEAENVDRIDVERQEQLTRTIDIARAFVDGKRDESWKKQQIASLIDSIEVVTWLPPDGYQRGDLAWEQVVKLAKRQKRQSDHRGRQCSCEAIVFWDMV